MIDLYLDETTQNKISESAQSTLASDYIPGTNVFALIDATGFTTTMRVRIGALQRTVQSVSGNSVTLSGDPIALTFLKDTLMTSVDMQNADIIDGVINEGFEDTKALYLYNDDSTKQYINIIITTLNDSPDLNVRYALDNNGGPQDFLDTLSLGQLPLTDSTQKIKIWRKVTVSPGYMSASVVDVKHRVTAMERVTYQ